MDTMTLQGIQQLSIAERIQLVEDIWDSIATAPESLSLTDSQRQELDNRLEAHHQDASGSSWADVKSRLQS